MSCPGVDSKCRDLTGVVGEWVGTEALMVAVFQGLTYLVPFFLLIYLAVPCLTCGMQDLPSSLQHANS